ncbi:MAG: hypothetical protein EAY81_00990 [Bacteroidetes bacterium]|nr:MAG: hypothetical protein EAY81_00990 [Bacteroidota bacterium]
MTTDLKHAFENMHLLSRAERKQAMLELQKQKPDFLLDLNPFWGRRKRCIANVLIVADGSLNFEFGSFGLSEFLTSFNKLNQILFSNIRYKVTIAHRDSQTPVNTNNVVVNRIANFDFATSVNLNDFDQIWLFGITPISLPASGDITRPQPVPINRSYLFQDELDAITNYMNAGGNVFATGDHGLLGSALCSQIPRIKDMRHWEDFGTDEVGMTEPRRNDTNRPASGTTVSTQFSNQSDDIPQAILVRTYDLGRPHPLLSIRTSLRPSGIIDIMPDHPHEGECKSEKSFKVIDPTTGDIHRISSQIIARSLVLDGSSAARKDPTEPHLFPSIAVFNGRPANVGRIVVDSTWHHFVNINLIGSGEGVGFSDHHFDIIQQYYMNIANWMLRKSTLNCAKGWIFINLLKDSQIIEANLNNPNQPLKEIKINDLHSIGILAKEILSSAFTPMFAEEFMSELIEDIAPEYVKHLQPWDISNTINKSKFFNEDFIISTAIGAGFVAIREHINKLLNNDANGEEIYNEMPKYLDEGLRYGLSAALEQVNQHVEKLNLLLQRPPQKRDPKKR